MCYNAEYKNSSRLRGTFLSPTRKFERVKALDFTAVSAIIFIHC